MDIYSQFYALRTLQETVTTLTTLVKQCNCAQHPMSLFRIIIVTTEANLQLTSVHYLNPTIVFLTKVSYVLDFKVAY